ncbi:YdeI/OmpD-associated family protein [Suipraeoptans intestinalis]|uniref:YdeI/OmpD-associated family protein n=1 Tax=Suipraeoptans intestinalis TaxID=2606628 RepID=UPI0023EF8F62|nr:YdeI/OmpD-associated family protein [Suipraeoptans intestinalis]MDD7769328.1 YdeI/OmpD-associated family protein [Suipraeoptans intestinalis]
MEAALRKKIRLDKFKQIRRLRKAREASPFDEIEMRRTGEKKIDLGIAYVYDLSEMKEVIDTVWKEKILPVQGCLYLIYPKTKNKKGYASIGRDSIFPYLKVGEDGYVKGTELKFCLMAAVDETYTLVGMKYLPQSLNKTSAAASGRVEDYVDRLEDVKAYLEDYPKQLEFYRQLTPGYQKDWARYLYSAKTEATLQRRQKEMVEILGAGYKTKQLYRAAEKDR